MCGAEYFTESISSFINLIFPDYGDSVFILSFDGISGTFGPVIPGIFGAVIPGIFGPAMLGIFGPVIPGILGPVIPGIFGLVIPGIFGPVIPGILGPVIPGILGPVIPGIFGLVIPGIFGLVIPGIFGPAIPAPGFCLPFDFSAFSEKQIMVLKHVEKIASGKALSYGQVADELGLGKAARFVGNCMSNNRFPLLIPCHRVIKSDGSLGKYGAGAGVSDKKRLLKEEGWLK